MNPFYIILILFVALGFFTGYKTGFVKLVFALFTTAAAIGCSCFFYKPLSAQTADWWDINAAISELICFIALCLVSLFFFLLLIKRLPWFRWDHKVSSKIAGGILGTVLFAGVFAILIILTDFVEAPAALTAKLEQSGISNTVESGANAAGNLFTKPGSTKNEQQVLAAASAGNEAEKSYSLAFTQGVRFQASPDLEQKMLLLVNGERKKAGLPALLYDSALTSAARKHAEDMLARGYFSHNTPEGITPFQRLRAAKISYRFAGENLAFAPTVSKAHEELMLSPGHRANILNRQYKKAGIAVMHSGASGIIVAQEFKD